QWPDLVAPLTAPEQWAHCIVQLAAASSLTDLGNGVGITATGPKRTADLWIAVGPAGRADAEVKAPIPLQRGESIDARLAATLVKKAADKRGGGGQLGAGYPGMVVLGGFDLTDQSL